MKDFWVNYHFLSSQVRDGPSESSPLIGRYCGTEMPPMLQSTQRSMFIQFKTDSSISNHGFTAEYGSAEQGSLIFFTLNINCVRCLKIKLFKSKLCSFLQVVERHSQNQLVHSPAPVIPLNTLMEPTAPGTSLLSLETSSVCPSQPLTWNTTPTVHMTMWRSMIMAPH